MPYTEKQRKLFAAAANNPDIAKKNKMSQATARRLLKEAMNNPVKKTILR